MKTKQFTYKYSRVNALKPLNVLLDVENEIIIDDVVRTKEFIASVFDEYEGVTQLEQVNFAFVIPTRASRFVNEYWEEVYEFLPALRHIKNHDAFRVLSSLPPFRIEMYGAPGAQSSGVLMFAPIFTDMLKDYKNKLLLSRKVRSKINETIDFAHKKFGVTYVGLGATLPRLTKYGKTVKADVITTTGHAGTTLLIKKTVLDVIATRPQLNPECTIGFIGGGAIGVAAMQSLADALPNARFITYDRRPKMNKANKKIMKKLGVNLEVASSNEDLINNSQLIVSAITSVIDLAGIDLVGKIIVDDSQPGSFSREQVLQNGGELLWVVGKDMSQEQFITRRQEYSYGPHGLHHKFDIWGCEAEVAAIAHANRPEAAIRAAVTLQDIRTVEVLFDELGVGVAEYQSHGQLND